MVAPAEPEFSKASDENVAIYKQSLKGMQLLASEMSKSKRARKAIEGWKRDIAVKTTGGEFAMYIDDGDFKIEERRLESPDFVMACADPRTLLDGLNFKLDRLARFLAREKKEQAAG